LHKELAERALELIHREAALLDRKDWTGWLELYLPDAEFWIPAWDDESTLTEDPRTEVSLMYYASRAGLEDRVWRIRSGMSSASVPLPRTCHLVTGAHVEAEEGDDLRVASSFAVHSFKERKTQTFYGRYEHTLRTAGRDLRIARKKIIVLNDVIPGVLDVYSI
jgi:3-phenylpropionate/cinnamic acid dioxygenase small subunit